MKSDIRSEHHFGEIVDVYSALYAPGSGHVHWGGDVSTDVAGKVTVFVGKRFGDQLEHPPRSSLYCLSSHGDPTPIPGSSDAILPRVSPDGQRIAWVMPAHDGSTVRLSGRDFKDFRDHHVRGLVESVSWSNDSNRLLMVVADAGADTAGIHGGQTMRAPSNLPDWLPELSTPAGEGTWRRAWVLDLADGALRRLGPNGINVWDACWTGDQIVVVASDSPGEGEWYRSKIVQIDAQSGSTRTLYRPRDQIGTISGSPDGRWLLFVEAFCSDRGLACGTLKCLDLNQGVVRDLDTGSVEVSHIEWTAKQAVFAGMRGLSTVVGTINQTGTSLILWQSKLETCGEWLPWARSHPQGALIAVESYGRPPRLAIASAGRLSVAVDFEATGANAATAGTEISRVSWQASDGREIDGLLVGPGQVSGRAPLVVDIHGGPVWSNRPRWAARTRATPAMVSRGWRILYPNPRGSSGYGQPFARAVLGDMGGADAGDILAGIDALIQRGIADPSKIACTGSSYGGFMSTLLPTLDQRFAAAAPISPVVNWLSQHGTSQIPFFDETFLASSAYEGRLHFERSPVMRARENVTPTLLIAGGLDRNTPADQAREYYTALQANGTYCALLIYPTEGHSVRGWPAYLDSAARILSWFDKALT